MKLIYPAVFYPFSDGSGGYVVEFPDLPGCVTEGNPVPVASKYENVVPRERGQINMVLLDMDAYAEQYGEKAVRKNVTIPAWLNTFAEKQKLFADEYLIDLNATRAYRAAYQSVEKDETAAGGIRNGVSLDGVEEALRVPGKLAP